MITLLCMVYCMLSDPGQISPGQGRLPRRAHKAWTHDRPIRRYDHYCRWMMNSVGLLNHREFLIMLLGLVSLCILGACLDVILLALTLTKIIVGDEEASALGSLLPCAVVALHLAYATQFGYYANKVLCMHLGFIGRNVLCAEWKEDMFYRVGPQTRLDEPSKRSCCDSRPVTTVADLPQEERDAVLGLLVEEIDVEDYNRLDVATFVYDPATNDFDRGLLSNWFAFWCVPRWGRDELGEF